MSAARIRDSLTLAGRQIALALAVLFGFSLLWTLMAHFNPPLRPPGVARTLDITAMVMGLYVVPLTALAWFGYHVRKPWPALLLGISVPLCICLFWWLQGLLLGWPWPLDSVRRDRMARIIVGAFFAASSLGCVGAGGALFSRDKGTGITIWMHAFFLGFFAHVIAWGD